MKDWSKKRYLFIAGLLVIFIFTFSIFLATPPESIPTSTQAVSEKKIEWGIKRNDNHQQPDLGSRNKALIEQYKGIAIGNPEQKYVYLTFDEGYEAGYTPKILEVLKQNEVNATFFITAHFLNTQEGLVKQMIADGHIVGNHTPKSLMPINSKGKKV